MNFSYVAVEEQVDRFDSDLPRLLQFQMLVAQANTSFDLPLALSLLDYVIAASSTPLGAQLNYQASALRSSLSKTCQP